MTFLTRPDSGGRFFGINNTGTDASGSVLRVFDLAGNTVQETNAATVNTQLASLGKRQIGVFHHEARRLSNGNLVTLGTVEQILTDVQGPGPVDVVGDMIIVLDRNLRVLWTWDVFDHLDVTRQAVLGETCSNSNACMSHFLASDGNDWTHANAVQQTPEGNLIISLRHQDWVVKVDYENGAGDGHIFWRLGNAGDFIIQSNDPNAWFSHQHDPNFLGDNVTLELFDNGNTRRAVDANANSRGQVLVVNEDNRTVALSLNQDLGVYSGALGSAQRLPNGDYHFDAGSIGASAISFEVTSAGGTMRAIQAGAVEYRTFRLPDLYSGLN
jgi:arylsulfate sulfotransferase